MPKGPSPTSEYNIIYPQAHRRDGESASSVRDYLSLQDHSHCTNEL